MKLMVLPYIKSGTKFIGRRAREAIARLTA